MKTTIRIRTVSIELEGDAPTITKAIAGLFGEPASEPKEPAKRPPRVIAEKSTAPRAKPRKVSS